MTNIPQQQTEDIFVYARRFWAVQSIFIRTLLNNDTIEHYFIQRLDDNATRRGVLTDRPLILEEPIEATHDDKVIKNKYKWVKRRIYSHFHSYLSVNSFKKTLRCKKALPNQQGCAQPTPLATREPTPLMTCRINELWIVKRQTTKSMCD